MQYRYDPSGLLLAVDDLATDKHSTYCYDAAGRRIAERTEQEGVLYQDNAYWYRIADANGLTGRDALQVNQQLSLPPLANTTYDRADSMRPYDASLLIGDTTPNMPPPDSGGCGFLQILVIVISVVVAAFAPQFIAPLVNSMACRARWQMW